MEWPPWGGNKSGTAEVYFSPLSLRGDKGDFFTGEKQLPTRTVGRIATAGVRTGFAMTGYKECSRTGRRGRRPLRTGTRCAVERATARVAPTEGYKQYRGRADVGIGPYALFTDRIL